MPLLPDDDKTLRGSIARWSGLMLLACVAIPGFGVIAVLLNPNIDAAWPARAVLVAACLSVFAMGRGPYAVARWMPLVASGACVGAMSFFATRLHTGNVTPTHVVAFQLLYVLPLMVMRTPAGMALFTAITLGLVTIAYQGLEAPEVPFLASLSALIILGTGTAVATLARGRAEAALRESQRLLEQRVLERTEQLETEVQTRRAAETDAMRASRAKSRFLATMSHELRTPLNAITGYTELVQDELLDLGQPQLSEDLDRVKASAEHLLRMVADVLDLSRIEAGELTLDFQDVDAAARLAELERLVAGDIQRADAAFHMEVEPGLWVHTDPDRFAQIVINLVTNALKFTPEGHVTLRTRLEGTNLVLDVEDTGIGIAPDDLDRIFHTFVQVDGSSTRIKDGVGLGLALSKDLAQRLGGSLTARSQPGKGSTFTLRLPDAWNPGLGETAHRTTRQGLQ